MNFLKRLNSWTAALALLAVGAAPAAAAVKTQTVDYTDEGVELRGYFAWDDSIEGRRPGVLVVHEWWGLNDYARSRAEQLAKMGYVAFALDMYGKGKVTEHPSEAGKWASAVRASEQAWRQRGLAGLKVLAGNELVDPSKLAAIGYCFGGSTVLQLAASGADLKAAASFHGAIPEIDESEAQRIKARVLICHGAADSFIRDEDIDRLRGVFEKADVDYELIYYAGARHSFTNPDADKRGLDGLRYNKKADERSWRQLRLTLEDEFGS